MLPLLLTLLLQGPAAGVPAGPVAGTGSPKVTIPRIEATVQIDGALDEAPWQQAARLGGFSQYQPADGRPAEEETEVLVWYSPEAIHFGIIAHDKSPSTIRATVADRDNLDREDNVTVYLDTFNDRRRAFFFAVNAARLAAGRRAERGAVQPRQHVRRHASTRTPTTSTTRRGA